MFFPKKVYRCDCLADVIAFCLTKQVYSLTGIFEQINKIKGRKIYCARCGENNEDIVLSCKEHMPMVIFGYSPTVIDVWCVKTCCLMCTKRYLQQNYHIFRHDNFN